MYLVWEDFSIILGQKVLAKMVMLYQLNDRF